MKLSKLKVFIVGNKKPYWGGKYFIFVKLTSDNGVIGYGEVYSASISPQAMKIVIEDVFDQSIDDDADNNVATMSTAKTSLNSKVASFTCCSSSPSSSGGGGLSFLSFDARLSSPTA